MKIFTAGIKKALHFKKDICKELSVYALESFFYIDERVEKNIPYFKDFLLDSGAFTLFNAKKKDHNIVWEEYIDKYADFIKRNNVKNFFELDIDSLIGYENVLRLRKRLEDKTGRQCIPVMHKSRGLQEYYKMCSDYDYIAIGTIGDYNKRPDILLKLLTIANKQRTKVHGLGYTRMSNLHKMPFYSVDSTSWTTGNRFGYIYKFDGKTIIKFDKKDGQRLADTSRTALNNFREWIKYQDYADKHFFNQYQD